MMAKGGQHLEYGARREMTRATVRASCQVGFVFCILRSKLIPTWQLEDSSIYNVGIARYAPLSGRQLGKNETRLTAAQRKS